MTDRLTGFKPLRPGKIHLRCPRCKRKRSNLPRHKDDPEGAVLAEAFCVKCGAGGKDGDVYYYDAQGEEVLPAWLAKELGGSA